MSVALALALVAVGSLASAGITVVLMRRRAAPPPTGGPPEPDFRAVFESMQVGVTVTDLRGEILYTNPTDAEMHGYTATELVGQPARTLAPKVTRKTVISGEVDLMKSWTREALNVRKNGEVFPVRLRTDLVRDRRGRPQGIVTVCEDVTEEQRAKEAEAAEGLKDTLTGLAGRAFVLELVQRAIRRAARHADYHFALLFVDFERFKLINESLGHDAGDTLLAAIARRLVDAIRPNDVAARLAGDEFALLLDGLRAPEDASTVAERVITALDAPFTIEGREIYVTPSVGIAYGRPSGADAEQQLKDAREAMYSARASGRNLYGVFEETSRRRVTQRLHQETDLRNAIDDEDLRAVYKPIVALDAGVTVGFEALVRWQHKERGLISPGEFIPAAEETGLVVPIGWWMVETAVEQLAEWRAALANRPVTVNVNLSVRQLKQPRLVERILTQLHERGVPPAQLKLEVTESMLLDDVERQLATLRELRRAGIGVVIDDFGTGYSSLSYLQRVDFDVLKIDRSFLPADDSREAWDLVRTIITLAHDRGAAVVAEGVETADHAARLTALGCDWGQGYWFARPLAPSDALARLRAEAVPEGSAPPRG